MLTTENFASQILGVFRQSIFRLVASFRIINYLSGECSDRLVERLVALECPLRSQDVAIYDFGCTSTTGRQ